MVIEISLLIQRRELRYLHRPDRFLVALLIKDSVSEGVPFCLCLTHRHLTVQLSAQGNVKLEEALSSHFQDAVRSTIDIEEVFLNGSAVAMYLMKRKCIKAEDPTSAHQRTG